MSRKQLITIAMLLLLGIAFVGYRAFDQARSQESSIASRNTAKKYLQAVLVRDIGTIDCMSPSFSELTIDDITEIVFNGQKPNGAVIRNGEALNATTFRIAAKESTKPYEPSSALSDISRARSSLLRTFPAEQVEFYKFNVKETRGEKRILTAYITVLRKKNGDWVVAPGITGGLNRVR
jgi:hypothetical protein